MPQPTESFYVNITLNDVQLAAIYYPFLIELARHKHCLTYGELVQQAKDKHPDLGYVQNAIATSTGRKLDVVRIFTAERALPDVTSLIISKSAGECGSGFTDAFDPIKAREEVFAYDWSNISGEFDMYIETAEQKAKPRIKITKDKAKELTLDYYQAHKTELPKTITTKRDDIIAMILDDYSVEEAFKLARDA